MLFLRLCFERRAKDESWTATVACGRIFLLRKQQMIAGRGNTVSDIGMSWDQIYAMMDSMDGIEYEHFCARVLRADGYTDVYTTKASGDHGADILAKKDGKRFAIQCKRYEQNVGAKAVQQVYAAKAYYGADIAVVMSNTQFTRQAREEAEILGVLLWPGTTVAHMARGIIPQNASSSISLREKWDAEEEEEKEKWQLGVLLAILAIVFIVLLIILL